MITADVLASPALPVLLALEAAGVRFKLDDDGHLLVSPPGALTAEQRDLLRQHEQDVRVLVQVGTDQAVQVRREVFERQMEVASPTGVPAFLFRTDVPYVQGCCFSCGDALEAARFGRCWRCALAWRLACRVAIPGALGATYDQARVV